MELLTTAPFWVAVGQIILIDILLGGDNAVVIALACRNLEPEQRRAGILWGTAGAIVLRCILIFFAVTLLTVPYLKLVGAALLVWIGVKLLLPQEEDGHGEVAGSNRLWGAIKTVIVADLVMSIDNVIAIAGAAHGAGPQYEFTLMLAGVLVTIPVLVIFGLLVSIPIVIGGSRIVLSLMDRFPIIITLGGMLLGWIAGGMAVSDPIAREPLAAWAAGLHLAFTPNVLHYAAAALGAALVWVLGWLLRRARPQ